MPFKDLLLALTTYPEPTPVTAVEDAVDLAAALGAKLSAVACEAKMKTPRNVVADYLLDIPAMVAAELQKSAVNAQSLLALFEAAAGKKGVLGERFQPQCMTAEVPDVFTGLARLRDLTLVPVPTGDFIDQWYAEAVIFGAGRPVMILPHRRQRTAPFKLGSVMIAWDGSRTAARAVADALPILEAGRVHVLTVTDEKEIQAHAAEDLAASLARRGIQAELHRVPSEGRRIGDVLETQVAVCSADLLVMGAFGHSRLRQFILGGATRSMLSRPPVPILMSH